MKKLINTDTQAVTFTFEGLEPVTLRMSQVTPANATYAMLHGFAARIGDNAAITKSAENGFTVTEAMRRDAVLELVDHYASGSAEWNVKASAKRALSVEKATRVRHSGDHCALCVSSMPERRVLPALV